MALFFCAIYEGKDLHSHARWFHFGAGSQDEAVDMAMQRAHPAATGFILYSKPTVGGYIDKRLGVYDVACMGCGDRNHPRRNCLPRCSQCGAIATGLTPDESDPSVGLFGPGPMCVACDKKEQREYSADPTQPGALLINLRHDAQYGKV